MTAFRLRPVHVLAVLTVIVGCSKKSSSAGDGTPSDIYPAPHTALPQVKNYGGPVQAHPVLYAITTTDNSLAPQLVDFTRRIGSSSYFTILGQYGVGPGTFGTALTMPSPGAVPISDAAETDFLSSMLDGTHPEYGVPDVNSNYILYYSSSATFSDGGCNSYYAFHSSLVLPSGAYAGTEVAYSIVPTCPPYAVVPGGPIESQIEEVTDAASHEIAEAATDPDNSLAWDDTDNNSGSWDYVSEGGEIGDMCQSVANVDAFPPDMAPYGLQRIWSNSAARSALGIDPCQPTSAVYFNAAPVLTAKTTLDMGGGDDIGSPAVHIPVGGEATIPLQVFSSGPTVPIAITASDGSGFFFFDTTPPNLSFSLDRDTALNGEIVHLTIHVDSAGTDYPGFEFFAVIATVGTSQQFWPGVVAN